MVVRQAVRNSVETAFCQSWPRARGLLAVVGTALGEVVERGVGGVAEGAQHTGDVAQGGLLGAALGEASGRVRLRSRG